MLYLQTNKIFSLLLYYFVKFSKNITLGKNVVFKKKPYIIKHKKASIEIGDYTTINSDNYGYHINMFQKCKLYADRAGGKIKIGKKCRIHGTCIHAYNEIQIGDNCLIAANTQIIDGNGHKLSFPDVENRIYTTDEGIPIIIEDNVWIGANSIILGGTTIGYGSIIAAGSIVKGNVPPMSIFGGNPAKIIKTYK